MRQILICAVLVLASTTMAWAAEPAAQEPAAAPLFSEGIPALAATEAAGSAEASPAVPACTPLCTLCRCSVSDTGVQGFCVEGGSPCLQCDPGETVHVTQCSCEPSCICPAPPIPACSIFNCQPALDLSCR